MFVVTIVVWAIQLIMVGQGLDQIHRQEIHATNFARPNTSCSARLMPLLQDRLVLSRRNPCFSLHTLHTLHTHTHIFIIFSGFKLSKGLSRSQSVDAVSCMALIIFDQGDPGRTQTERNAHAAHAFASSLSWKHMIYLIYFFIPWNTHKIT